MNGADVIVPPHQRPWGRDIRGYSTEVLTLATVQAMSDPIMVQQVAEMSERLRFGLSSAGLVRWAIVSPGQPFDGFMPCDWDDLERCELAYALAPDWLQRRMASQLLVFRAHVARHCSYVSSRARFEAEVRP